MELLLGEEIPGGAGWVSERDEEGNAAKETGGVRPATTATDRSLILFRKSEASAEHTPQSHPA